MKKRITLLALASVIGALAIMGAAGHFAIQRSIQASLQGRLALVKVIAGNIDYALQNNIAMLEGLAAGDAGIMNLPAPAMEALLAGAYKYSIFGGGVFLIGQNGQTIAAYPPGARVSANFLDVPEVKAAFSGAGPVVSNISSPSGVGEPGAYILVPLKRAGGGIALVAAGKIDPAGPMFTRILGSLPNLDGARIEIIDSGGVALYSNDPRRILAHGDHDKFIANLIAQRKPAVDLCHNCHQETGAAISRSEDVLVFTPLTQAPWGVAVMEPKKAIFAPADALRNSFLAMGIAYAILAALLAMGLSESIVKPIRTLIEATARLAREDMSAPISLKRNDEIGALAASFETMRGKLAQAMEEARNYGVDLEKRVMDRTMELETQRRRLATLLNQALKAQEEERLRIARELHDETSQALLALGMSIEVAAMALRKKELTEETLLENKSRAGRLLSGIKRIIHDLRPPALDDLGFASSIRWLLDTHMREKGIEYELIVDGPAAEKALAALDKGAELRLFRALQEAVINIARHSGAKHASVSIQGAESGLRVEVADDGAGFDMDAVFLLIDGGQAAGFGLLGMKERVAQINGTMDIESAPGKGTKIRIFLPLTKGKRGDGQDPHPDRR